LRGEPTLNHRANLTISTDDNLLKQLKSEAERRGTSINQITNSFLIKYFLFYRHVEDQRGTIIPHDLWKDLLELIDEKELAEIVEKNGIEVVLVLFEHNNVPATIDNLIKYFFETMALWAGAYHRFSHHTDNHGNLNLVFEHSFGIKWSRVLGLVFTNFIKKSLGLSSKHKARSTVLTMEVKP
jgi:hypothetical protein